MTFGRKHSDWDNMVDALAKMREDRDSLHSLLKERDTKWQDAEHRAAAYKERAEGAEKALADAGDQIADMNKEMLRAEKERDAEKIAGDQHAADSVYWRKRAERLEGALKKAIEVAEDVIAQETAGGKHTFFDEKHGWSEDINECKKVLSQEADGK